MKFIQNGEPAESSQPSDSDSAESPTQGKDVEIVMASLNPNVDPKKWVVGRPISENATDESDIVPDRPSEEAVRATAERLGVDWDDEEPIYEVAPGHVATIAAVDKLRTPFNKPQDPRTGRFISSEEAKRIAAEEADVSSDKPVRDESQELNGRYMHSSMDEHPDTPLSEDTSVPEFSETVPEPELLPPSIIDQPESTDSGSFAIVSELPAPNPEADFPTGKIFTIPPEVVPPVRPKREAEIRDGRGPVIALGLALAALAVAGVAIWNRVHEDESTNQPSPVVTNEIQGEALPPAEGNCEYPNMRGGGAQTEALESWMSVHIIQDPNDPRFGEPYFTGDPDGTYDDETEVAVVDLQEDARFLNFYPNVEPDKIPGEVTCDAINKIDPAYQPSFISSGG